MRLREERLEGGRSVVLRSEAMSYLVQRERRGNGAAIPPKHHTSEKGWRQSETNTSVKQRNPPYKFSKD